MLPHNATVSSLSEGSPNSTRVNEDAYYVQKTGDGLYILVADGASVRTNTDALTRFMANQQGEGMTPASYASRLTRDTIAALISRGDKATPTSLLLAANTALQEKVSEIYGGNSSDAVLKAEPHLDILRDDPRLIRLVLPICVATIAYIDLNAAMVQFAHAGDTALFVHYLDDTVVRVTNDNMEQHDTHAIQIIREKQQTQGHSHFSDLIHDDEATAVNRQNGIYHNFVDEAGNTDAQLGVGVVNGQPELAAYIQEGSVKLQDVRALLVCSDGFIWPTPWGESQEQREARLRLMLYTIATDGIHSYANQLRQAEADDQHLDAYPRLKVHDDLTAVYLEVQRA